MSKKSTKKQSDFNKILLEMKSYIPVNRKGWWIKFSTYKSDSILITFMSMFTAQTIIKHFTTEDDAVNYINFITEKDPKNEHEDLA